MPINIFKGIPVPEVVPKYPHKLIELADHVFELADEAEARKNLGLKRSRVRPTTVRTTFPVVEWHRQIGGFETSLSLTDKRKLQAGIMLTALAVETEPGMSAVQAFIVNDEFATRGLRRVVNGSLISETASQFVQDQQASTARIKVNGTPAEAQVNDFVRAISTVLMKT